MRDSAILSQEMVIQNLELASLAYLGTKVDRLSFKSNNVVDPVNSLHSLT